MKAILIIRKKIDFEILSLVLATLLLLLSCPCMGQVQQKKALTENDYQRWGTLEVKAISDQGKWASYAMRYENHSDTLFVQNIAKNKSYVFPKGNDGRFGGEQLFAFLAPDSKLKVKELPTGKIAVYDNVKRYELAKDGQYIITLNKGYGEKCLMQIRNSNGKVIDSIEGVSEYALNADKDAIVYASSQKDYSELRIIHFAHYSHTAISKANGSHFFNLMWHKDSKSVAFFQETDSANEAITVNYYRIADKKLFSLDYGAKVQSKNMEVFKRTTFTISDDGKKVFFMVAKKKNPNAEKPDVPEIWHGNDKWLYADGQRQQTEGDIPKIALWYPDTGLYLQISDDELPSIMLSGQQGYAVLYNKFSYGLQSKYYEEADFYLTDLKNGSKELILKKQSVDLNQMGFDPFSNRILYYRESNWWMYDPVEKTHTNLTKKVTTHWDNNNTSDAPHQFGAYGNPGWTNDGKNVLLYDANDIWLVAIDGSSCKRLTRGYEKNLVYRITPIEYDWRSQSNYDGRKPTIFDISKDLLLEATNSENWSTGYFIYNDKSKEQPIVYEASKIDEIRKSKNTAYIFQTQTFNQSPRLEFRRKNQTASKILFHSNKQQKDYSFGKSELLYYYNSKGQKLKAALFYPAHYNPTKKYPMVVHIYDVMSDELHQYVNPSFLNREGFNVTNYTLNGYFVLMPDIIYQMGNPGSSAVDCVTAGVNAVTGKGLVDKDKIGLFGHSFGGYETNFIISQTNIFKAAVSGAGVSDIISYYFNISRNGYFQSDMWRFENQQFRIGKSLYEDKEAYVSNSPIMHAENVKTPLLLWAGKNDRIIPWNQSIAFYLALRKLEVSTQMLVYPDEDHSLENPENQKNLSQRMMEWFDYWLKGEAEFKAVSKETE